MKEIKSQKYVLFILRSAFYFMTIFTLFWTVGILVNLGTIKSTGEMGCLVLYVLQAGDYAFLAYNLAEIVECNIYTIFSIKNSNNFKKLGYGMIFLSMIEEISNFFNEKSFSKNMYEKIYKYIFQCEYIEVNLLEQFTSKELLEELLKREKSR